jgi:hypothetical protein
MQPGRTFFCLAFCVAFSFSTSSNSCGNIISFDDYTDNGSGTVITNGYQGLVWSNFSVLNTTLYANQNGTNGFLSATVSPPNVAYDTVPGAAEIDDPGSNFIFSSVEMTGVSTNFPAFTFVGLVVQAFRNNDLIEQEYLAFGNSTPVTMGDFTAAVDRVDFYVVSGGSQPYPATFAIDNLSYEFVASVPEPSSLLLCGMGVLFLLRFLRQKRMQ